MDIKALFSPQKSFPRAIIGSLLVLHDQNVSSYKNWILHGKSQFPKVRPDLEARAATELAGRKPTIKFTKELVEVIPNGHGIDFAIRPNGTIFVGTKHLYLAGSKDLATAEVLEVQD